MFCEWLIIKPVFDNFQDISHPAALLNHSFWMASILSANAYSVKIIFAYHYVRMIAFISLAVIICGWLIANELRSSKQ